MKLIAKAVLVLFLVCPASFCMREQKLRKNAQLQENRRLERRIKQLRRQVKRVEEKIEVYENIPSFGKAVLFCFGQNEYVLREELNEYKTAIIVKQLKQRETIF